MISNIWYSEDDRAWRPGTPLSHVGFFSVVYDNKSSPSNPPGLIKGQWTLDSVPIVWASCRLLDCHYSCPEIH